MRVHWIAGLRLLLAAGLLCHWVPSGAQFDRDILWKIVSSCLAKDAGPNCPSPRQQGPLPAGDPARACRRSTDVWGQAGSEFAAIRDIKMCACVGDRNFVHGLAIPLTRIPGVEGPVRPDGIWQFAWDVALEKIGPGQASAIGLAVNPKGRRGQEQLHIHIVRLREDYLRRLDAHPDYLQRVVKVASLSQVWGATPPPAGAGGEFSNFGLLVTAAADGGYTVRVLSPEVSPEGEYTQYQCP